MYFPANEVFVPLCRKKELYSIKHTLASSPKDTASAKNPFTIHYSLFTILIFATNLYRMNLHEYQAKELLKKYNVPVQEGFACNTVHEAEEAYRQIKNESGSSFAVIKAQIHAGGRGKGTVKETGINGVKVGKSLEEISDFANKILGGTLVTIQTGPAGKVVNKVLVAQDV